jgi:hypothetical protein
VIGARLSRRRKGVALAGLLAVAVLAGGAGIASGSGSPKSDDAAQGTQAAKLAKAQADKPQTPGDGVDPDLLALTRAALNGLVANGVIDQTQADGMQSRVASGHIDNDEVLSSGLLNQAQLDQVNAKLIAIKMSFAPHP